MPSQIKRYKKGERFVWTPELAARLRSAGESPAEPEVIIADPPPAMPAPQGIATAAAAQRENIESRKTAIARLPQGKGLSARLERIKAGIGKYQVPAASAAGATKGPIAGPANKEPSTWGDRLGKGLSAAAYAMQANVGRPIAGQEWKQGILRGIAGIGALKAGEAAAAEKKAGREESLADKLTYLKAEQAGKVTGPSWEEKFKKTEAGKMDRLNRSLGAVSARVESKRMADIGSAKDDAGVERWIRSWKHAFDSFGEYEKYKPGYDQLVSDRAQKFNDTLTLQETGVKPKSKPALKAPPLPKE